MLYLASQSPRRRDLLARLGLPFATLDVDVAEVRAPGESAFDYVRRVARDKARAGLRAAEEAGWVIGADTEVVLDDVVFGKPRDAADAAAMLRRLSGRTHAVVSVVVLADARGEREALSVSQVTFGALDDAAIAAYAASGEPLGKAGGYAIQGIAGTFAVKFVGSYTNVVGLPLYETISLLDGEHYPIRFGWLNAL